MKKYILAIALLACCGVAAAAFIKIHSSNISITTSENDDELILSASFPEKYSERVHTYVKTQLKMTDLADFRHLEIREYDTPDQRMHFHIKSRNGYVKIKMEKKKNMSSSCQRLRETGEGVKKLLAAG